MAKEKCFIIAPISTLPERVPLYLNDVIHCEHVIDHLLAPAVEKAGFNPIKPKAKGANLIHAEIVRNLQTAELVLCDMSGLNPNVLFELGIRTAMNKPICLVIDDVTKDAPFDLESVNHHEYVSDLRPWVLPAEVDKLAAHIGESFSEKENALWKHFALRLIADATERPSGPDDKIDLLLSEVEALRKQVATTDLERRRERLQSEMSPNLVRALGEWERKKGAAIPAVVAKATELFGKYLLKYATDQGHLKFWVDRKGAHDERLADLTNFAEECGIRVSIRVIDVAPEDPK